MMTTIYLVKEGIIDGVRRRTSVVHSVDSRLDTSDLDSGLIADFIAQGYRITALEMDDDLSLEILDNKQKEVEAIVNGRVKEEQ